MIEHRAGRLANAQRVHERRGFPAREPVGEQRRALGRLLGHRAKPREHDAPGIHPGQPLCQFVANAGDAGHPSGQNHVARGRCGDGKRSDRFNGTPKYASRAS